MRGGWAPARADKVLFSSPPLRPAQESQITGVKCMIVRGAWDWNLVKMEPDA
jgi:hypothetical protein